MFGRHDVLVVVGEALEHVVGVEDVTRVALFFRASFSFLLDNSLGLDNLASHLHGEDVVDFDVMRGEAIVEERRGEEHLVALVPKLGLILHVEREDVTRVVKPETSEDRICGDNPHENARVVQRSSLHAKESGSDGSHGSENVVDHDPPVVAGLEPPAQGVATVLALAHRQPGKDLTDGATALRQTLIHQILHRLRIGKQPSLESCGHIHFLSVLIDWCGV